MNKSPTERCHKLFPNGFRPEAGFVEPALDFEEVIKRLKVPRRLLDLNADGTPDIVTDRIDGEVQVIDLISVGSKDECWVWCGRIEPSGYGQIKLFDRWVRVHRVIYAIVYGQTPRNLCVCHRCDNKPCQNPYHFFLGTKSDNNWDKAVKGRAFRFVGSEHHKAKLSEEIIHEIRGKSTGRFGETARLAREYGVNWSTIERVLKGEIWKHVQ